MDTPRLPLRVLTIDDQPIILRTLKVVLGGLGITSVDEVTTVDIAEERLTGGPPYDLVICDLNLPGRDGIEFLRDKRAALASTAVILLSGEDERILQSVSAMGRAAGLNLLASLTKPATAAKISDALMRLEDVVPSRRKVEREVLPSPSQLSEMFSGAMLAMHYQPIVRLEDRALMGVEALLRGEHPELGDVRPQSIVQSADLQERAGEVTRFVLETAIADAGHMYADGMRINTCINLDGAALRQQLPDIVSDLAQRNGVPMASLTLEIAERAVHVDFVNALDVATRLRLKRCALSLDQFGSGSSSLAQLQDLPFTGLKIDRSIVTGCAARSAARSMIAACVGVARGFGMQTVAVGIEGAEDWEAVKKLGVDFAQGFHVADAMPASQIGDWAARWLARAG